MINISLSWQIYGDTGFTAKSLREAAVLWMCDNPRPDFVSTDWNTYLQTMVGVKYENNVSIQCYVRYNRKYIASTG